MPGVDESGEVGECDAVVLWCCGAVVLWANAVVVDLVGTVRRGV